MHRVLLFTLVGILTFLALSGFHAKWAVERELLAQAERQRAPGTQDSSAPATTPANAGEYLAAAPIALTHRVGDSFDSEGAIQVSADPTGSTASGSTASALEAQGDGAANGASGDRPADVSSISGDSSFGRYVRPSPFRPSPGDAAAPHDGEEERAPAIVQAWGSLLPLRGGGATDEYFVGRMHMELVPVDCDDPISAHWSRTRERGGLLTDMEGAPLEEVDFLFGQGVGGHARQPLSMRPSMLLAGQRAGELGRAWDGGLQPGSYRLRLWFEATGEVWEGRLILIGAR